MTARDPIFVAGAGGAGQTSPTEARLALSGLIAAGDTAAGFRDGAMYGPAIFTVSGTSATSPMTYQVGAGHAVVSRGSALGAYLGANDGAATVQTTAAPGTGSRYDLIYIQFPDVEQGDSDSVAVLRVVQGTSSGSPTVPYGDLPDGALAIATALVPAGTTRTDTGTTITKVVQYTVARGAPIPVRNQTERDALTGYAGLVARRLDTGLDNVHDGSDWDNFGAVTFHGQSAPVKIKTGSDVSMTSGAGQVVIDTGLSALYIVMLTNGDGGAQPFGIVSKVGSFSGGEVTVKWTDGATGTAIGTESVRTDWLAIGLP